MSLYFFIVLIVYSIALIIKTKSLTKKWTVLDIFILLVLIIFSGIRFNVGTDYGMYYHIYNTYISKVFSLKDYYSTKQEFGYYLLSWITKNISSSSYGIFWTSAIITYIPIYSRIKKESKNFTFSILLFILLGFYTGAFNIIRQWIAIAINFYANQYIEENRKKFVLLNIIGSFFHSTSIIAMLIQLVVKKIKPTFKFFVFIIVLGIISTIIFERMSFIFSMLDNLNPRYINYFESRPAGKGLKLLFVLRIIIILFVLILTKKTEYQYDKTLLIVSSFFMIIGFTNVFIARIEYYFSIVLVLLLPNILTQMEKKERLLYQYCFTVVFLVVFILSLMYYSDLIPYKTHLM
ncbi:hypothetical protein BHF71_01015 [Vulcanibacillus modesticaldus]|uniref:EpsG family protein n=1 Tax=Vulcanibacillus modesticaldus TaxID=337097 RepID=A0A1D2YVW1_9BACI|nr:EpsG family protein [Vulcanibacillus modesticaldus]OEF99787.1 hypothetical protein BHF71_01015 [Vulcanibacillus modesticaldus]